MNTVADEQAATQEPGGPSGPFDLKFFVEQMDRRFDRIEQRIDQFNAKIESVRRELDIKIGQLDAKIDRVDGKIHGVVLWAIATFLAVLVSAGGIVTAISLHR